MLDPREARTSDGLIQTGAHRGRVPPRYEPLLQVAIEEFTQQEAAASVYLYGSVATGVARSPESDVDLLTIGVGPEHARRVDRVLFDRYPALCRSVDTGVAEESDLAGDGDAAYGFRVWSLATSPPRSGRRPRRADGVGERAGVCDR